MTFVDEGEKIKQRKFKWHRNVYFLENGVKNDHGVGKWQVGSPVSDVICVPGGPKAVALASQGGPDRADIWRIGL